ncbi:MAG: serine/threonine protein kinase, partial [Planctomycetota bacterium]
ANIPDPKDPAFPSDEEFFAQWPRFRGPDGSGHSPHPDPPLEWDATSGKNIVWKVPVPLPGNSSPIVWDDRVFVTGADESRREVFCFDATSGKLLWSSELPGTPDSTAEPPEVMEDTGFAAPTPVTDGRRVFAVFANGDVGAFDYAGNVLWSHSLGIPDNAYGHASSLAMYHDLVIVQFDQGSPDDDKSRLIAYKAATGEVAWEVERPVANSWTTPLVVFDHDPPMLVTDADPYVIAYNVQDGSELWRLEGTTGDCGPSAVYADGVVYVGNEYSYLFAIPTDKSGELTEDDALWVGDEGLPDLCSPLIVDDMVIVVAYGALTAYDAAGGEVLWTFEFDDADFASSPSLADGRLYLFDKEGKSFVLEADREGAKIVSEPVLGEPCVTSPAFQPGRLYIRGAEHLFCIGAPE